MNRYNFYAERLIPVMLEHKLIDADETETMKDFIRDITGSDAHA